MIDHEKARAILQDSAFWHDGQNVDEIVDQLEQAVVIDLNDPNTENRVADAIRALATEGSYVPLAQRYPWHFDDRTEAGQSASILDAVVAALRGSAEVHQAERIPHLVAPLLALAEALEHGALVPGPPPGLCGHHSPTPIFNGVEGHPVHCELRAGHRGMHEGKVYDPERGLQLPGHAYWNDESVALAPPADPDDDLVHAEIIDDAEDG